jgi:hypothetical protein
METFDTEAFDTETFDNDPRWRLSVLPRISSVSTLKLSTGSLARVLHFQRPDIEAGEGYWVN